MGCFDEIIQHINTVLIKYIKELEPMIKIYTLQVAKLVHSDSSRSNNKVILLNDTHGHTVHMHAHPSSHGCLGFLQKPTVQACILPKFILDLGKIHACTACILPKFILGLDKIHDCTLGFCKNPGYPLPSLIILLIPTYPPDIAGKYIYSSREQ